MQGRGAAPGDRMEVVAGMTYTGLLMPRYEGVGEDILVLKLPSGYNVGLDVSRAESIRVISKGVASRPGREPPAGAGSLPKILLLSTGGTIASRVDYRTGAVTPIVSPRDLRASVPELAGVARVDTEVLFSEYSENMQPEHWTGVARRLDRLASSDYSGVIIAHGTDTMHYTSAFLSFALSGYPIPVALVGSQRSSDRPSSDAASNLLGGVRFLLECATPGIFVVMHHDQSDAATACHRGTRVRKMHTSRRDAFRSIGGEPAFLVDGRNVRRSMSGRFFDAEEYRPRIGVDPRVALVKYHPGYDPAHLDHIVDIGTKAVILEGTGLGHVGRTLYGSIRRASQKGVFLGMTSQCIDGRTRMTVYESGRDLAGMGVVPLHDMIPEVALVKAMWALGVSGSGGEFRRLMLSRVAGEYSP